MAALWRMDWRWGDQEEMRAEGGPQWEQRGDTPGRFWRVNQQDFGEALKKEG